MAGLYEGLDGKLYATDGSGAVEAKGPTPTTNEALFQRITCRLRQFGNVKDSRLADELEAALSAAPQGEIARLLEELEG